MSTHTCINNDHVLNSITFSDMGTANTTKQMWTKFEDITRNHT